MAVAEEETTTRLAALADRAAVAQAGGTVKVPPRKTRVPEQEAKAMTAVVDTLRDMRKVGQAVVAAQVVRFLGQ
jgi:hypothetical protein